MRTSFPRPSSFLQTLAFALTGWLGCATAVPNAAPPPVSGLPETQPVQVGTEPSPAAPEPPVPPPPEAIPSTPPAAAPEAPVAVAPEPPLPLVPPPDEKAAARPRAVRARPKMETPVEAPPKPPTPPVAAAPAVPVTAALAVYAGAEPCTRSKKGDSPVVKACAEGGTRKAKDVMKAMVKQAKAAGVKFSCDDCHKDDEDFAKLTADAPEKFQKLLAATGKK